jgi:multiple sugar transport system permease protein
MTSTKTVKRARRPRENVAGVSGATLFMVAFAAYFLIPLWWLFVSSTKARGDLTSTPGLWFGNDFALFQNIGDVFTFDGGVFGRWALNSILYAGVAGVLGTLLCVMAGYGFAKFVFPGRSAGYSTILAGVLVPGTLR